MPLAIITFLDGSGRPVDPSYGVPSYGGGHPSQGLPGSGNYPSQGLPPAGSIGTLPVFPFDPTRPSNELPGDQPGMDNSLPGQGGRPSQPIQLHPGLKLVVKYMACHGFIAVPDNELPQTPEPK